MINLDFLSTFFSSMSLAVNSLTATKFVYSTAPMDGRYVHIKGKKTGLTSWLKTKLNINPESSFQVFEDHIRIRTHSLIGDKLTLIPNPSINSVAVLFGREKKLSYLFVGLLTIPFGIGIILVLTWLSSKTLLIISLTDKAGLEHIFPYAFTSTLNIESHDAEKIAAVIYKLSSKS